MNFNLGWVGSILAGIIGLATVTVAVTHTGTSDIIKAAGNVFTTALSTSVKG